MTPPKKTAAVEAPLATEPVATVLVPVLCAECGEKLRTEQVPEGEETPIAYCGDHDPESEPEVEGDRDQAAVALQAALDTARLPALVDGDSLTIGQAVPRDDES